MNFLELKNQLLDIFEKKFKILYDRIDLIAENFDNFRNQELSRDNNIEKRLKTLIEKKIKEIKLKTDSNLKKINIVYEDLSKKIKDDYQQLKDEIYDKIIKDDYSKEIENIKFEVGFQDVSLTDFNPVHASLPSLIESYSEKVRNKIYLMSYQDNWVEYQNIVNANFKGFAKQGMKVNF